MTVDEAIKKLQEFSHQGFGETQVMYQEQPWKDPEPFEFWFEEDVIIVAA